VCPPHSAIASGASARPLFGRPGQGEKPDSSRPWIRHCRRSGPYSPRNLAARSRLFRPGRWRAAAACGRAPHAALGWAKWPRAARAGGRGAVPERRPAINCQKFTALCLFKPSSETEPYPPGRKTRPSSCGKQRGILRRLSAAVADRPDSWRGRAVSPPGGAGPGSPAPPGRGHRPACWAPELARSRD
jgi:hypothetical protein